MTDVADITTNAKTTTASLDRLVAGNEAKLSASIDNVADSTARLSTMTKDAGDVVDGIKKGNGTVGALLKEREIYDDLKEMLRNIKQRPWKIVWKE
ncbi:MAG: hypothetical protein R3E66_16785 [bacterium]